MTAPVSSVEAPSATPSTLDSELGELFGDYTGGGESPEIEDTTEGSTPDQPPETTAEGAATPPAGNADATPSDGTTPDAASDDPFKDTTPGTYMVNGQPVSIEDIRVFKEGGAVIRPESLPNIYSKLAAADTYAEKFNARDREYQTLAKVAEWTDSTSGKAYSGPEAAVEMRVSAAALLAENKLLVDHLTDPDKLYALLTTEQIPDGRGGLVERVILNPAALQTLQRENALTQRELSAAIRDHFKGVIAESSRPQAAALDYSAEAPRMIDAVARAASADHSVLTQADRTMLAKLLPSQVRDGKVSLDWQELVKERIQERTAAKASTQQLVSSTTDAVKKGQAAMAAAARGVRPPVRPVAAAPKAPTPQQERLQNEGDAFDAMERASAIAMRTAR